MKRSKINGFPIFGGGVLLRKEARHWYRLVSETSERGSEALGGDSYGC